MGKSNFNYWLEIQNMKERIEKLMDEVYDKFDSSLRVQDEVPSWKPVTDVYETTTTYVIQMELPGIEKDDINIELSGNELTISGERKFIKDVSSTSYHIMERAYGYFYRKFLLPKDVDKSKITANLHNGLLTITILKTEKEHKEVKIEITNE